MQKLVIDTNVVVSSLIQTGYPYLIINELFIEGKIQLCVSDQIMAEYYEVWENKKISGIIYNLYNTTSNCCCGFCFIVWTRIQKDQILSLTILPIMRRDVEAIRCNCCFYFTKKKAILQYCKMALYFKSNLKIMAS